MAAPRCRCGGEAFTADGLCKECHQFPTLGWQVGEYIQARCVVPDRDQVGEPFRLTDEQWRFLLRFYRVNPRTRFDKGRKLWRLPFVYARGAQIVRPQKWGKGPFSGAIIGAEATGPVVFDGWDAEGQPVGRPWATPIIQIAASSEDQTDNVWMALLPMIELGNFGADIPDTGLQRIYLPGGGWIEPVSAKARSRLGQRITFLVQDQGESATKTNGGRALADAQRRNIAGMGGRWLATCNAWDPSEESVAQYTAEVEAETGDVLLDDVEPPQSLSIRDKRERRKALKIVYGDSYWVDLDRIDSEIVALLKRDPAQAERWFLNRKMAVESAAFDPAVIAARADKTYAQAPKRLITVGIDGARFQDALGMVATDVETGYQWPLGIWERPEGAPDDYEHPFDDVDGALAEAFAMFDVWRVYIDPQYIDSLVEKWQGRYGQKRVIEWWTNRPVQICHAVRRFTTAVGSGEWSHSGDKDFVRHLKQAHKDTKKVLDGDHRPMWSLAKDRRDSPRKIDAAMAAVLSWEARGDCIASGGNTKKVYRVRGYH